MTDWPGIASFAIGTRSGLISARPTERGRANQAPNATLPNDRAPSAECLNCVIPLGERYPRQAIAAYVAHYHREQNHQGLDNKLITETCGDAAGRGRRRSRLGGVVNYYERAA